MRIIQTRVLLPSFSFFPLLPSHPQGVMPRNLVLEHFYNSQWISIHLAGGSDVFIKIVFLVHIFIACCMLVGWRTRWAVIGTWFMTVSLHSRNIIVLHGGDLLHRCIMLFAMFLPLGECFSIDAILRGPRSRPR